MRRGLQLSSPDRNSSASSFELVSAVTEGGYEGAWLKLLDDEWGFLMAKARLISDQRKEARIAEETGDGPGEGAASPFDKWTVKESA